MPIQKKEGHEGTKEQWKTAAENSYKMSHIEIALMSGEYFGITNTPLFGLITDANNFYDFFYLLHLEEVWSGAKTSLGAERIYIIPNGANQAFFILDSTKIRKDPKAVAAIEIMLKKGVNDLKGKPLPIFVLDCDTMQIARYEE